MADTITKFKYYQNYLPQTKTTAAEWSWVHCKWWWLEVQDPTCLATFACKLQSEPLAFDSTKNEGSLQCSSNIKKY